MKKRSKFVPVIAILLAVCTFAGCGRIIRPSKKEIIGTNLSFFSNAVKLDIRMDLVIWEELIMRYETTVIAHGDKADWDGLATVYYTESQLYQKCQTMCDQVGSVKKWRGNWAASDNTSPVPTIKGWLERAGLAGSYDVETVVPAQEYERLPELTEETYCITISESQVPFKSLCDLHPDNIFGGEGVFTGYEDVSVTFLVGVDDLIVDAIVIGTEGKNGRWFQMYIVPSHTDLEPKADIRSIDRIVAGLISEEWNFKIEDEKEDTP